MNDSPTTASASAAPSQGATEKLEILEKTVRRLRLGISIGFILSWFLVCGLLFYFVGLRPERERKERDRAVSAGWLEATEIAVSYVELKKSFVDRAWEEFVADKEAYAVTERERPEDLQTAIDCRNSATNTITKLREALDRHKVDWGKEPPDNLTTDYEELKNIIAACPEYSSFSLARMWETLKKAQGKV